MWQDHIFAKTWIAQQLERRAAGGHFASSPSSSCARVGGGQLSLYFSDDDEVDGGEQPDELIETGRILISEFRSDHYPLMAG
jgi:hypothetical protein